MEMENLLTKLTKDVKNSTKTLSRAEARYLVDTYYQMQAYRIRTANQVRSMDEEPHETLAFMKNNFEILENQVKNILQAWVKSTPIGAWLFSIVGVGPVIAAGLLAHLDITKAPTPGHFQAYAGLDPTKEWKKGELRPWNSSLKTLCWKLGESFVKQSNRESDIYGHLYKERKEYEIVKNEAGDYADQAKIKLEKYNIGKNTEAYKYYNEGKLPPAHIQERAKRYAVKIFLCHLHYAMYLNYYGKEPPLPYAIAILGHAHEIPCPNKDLIPIGTGQAEG